MKHRLILVDGNALSKKAWVASLIQTELERCNISCEVYVASNSTTPPLYMQMMQPVIDNEKTVIIVGTWLQHYLRDAMNQSPRMPMAYRYMLDRMAFGCSAIMVTCSGSQRSYEQEAEVVLGTERKTTLTEKELKQLLMIDMHWVSFMGQGLDRFRVNTAISNLDYYDQIIADRVRLEMGYINRGPGIGNWKPGHVSLLIGDRHGPSLQPYKIKANIAFVDMAKTGASYWLTHELFTNCIREESLYWVNAYNPNGSPIDAGFVGALNPKAVFALGDFAERWCASNHISFERVAHPQFHKRFRHYEDYPLIERLKSLQAQQSS